MCFSPAASFSAAAVTGAAGLVSMARVIRPRELFVAAVPLFFGLQQAIEGLVWLTLPMSPGAPTTTALTLTFLIFTQCVWPVFAPAAVWLSEPDVRRRRLMLPWVGIGAAIGAYLLWALLTRPHSAAVADDHIVYTVKMKHAYVIYLALAYVGATSLPMVLSSRRMLSLVGWVILAGSAVSYLFYRQAFMSVWCFFAAAASALIVLHVERSRRLQPQAI